MIAGSGTLQGNVVTMDGVVTPSLQQGASLLIDGDFSVTGGSVEIKVAGPDEVGRLTVTGDAVFDKGGIKLSFVDGFLPKTGDSFQLVAANSVSLGEDFGGITVAGVARGFEFDVSASDGTVTLTARNDARSESEFVAATFTPQAAPAGHK